MPRTSRIFRLSPFCGFGLFLLFAWAVLAPGAAAQTQFSITKCPDYTPPVRFEIDCSHVKDPAAQAACRPFLENQACKVFPAYRKITGIKMEDFCKTYQYVIYDQDSWPHKGHVGGLTGMCHTDYEAQVSVLIKWPNSSFGPYDVHEILHGYQPALGRRLPDEHVLFSSSLAEATRVIGDVKTYDWRMTRMKVESQNLEKEFQEGQVKPQSQCTAANTLFDELLYLKDIRVVYQYYEWLLRNPDKATGQENTIEHAQARFNRMFDAVSKGEARRFMAERGCNVF
jgi:hypothetical protein